MPFLLPLTPEGVARRPAVPSRHKSDRLRTHHHPGQHPLFGNHRWVEIGMCIAHATPLLRRQCHQVIPLTRLRKNDRIGTVEL